MFRCAVAGLAGFWVARALPTTSIVESLVALVVGGLALLSVLVLTREIGRDDFLAIRRVFSRA